MDLRVQKLAEVVVHYCVAVQPGDWVVLLSPLPAELLANACVSEILKAGGHPTTTFSSEQVTETIFRDSSDEQLAYLDPLAKVTIEQADVYIAFSAPVNTRALENVDPRRMGVWGKARQSLTETLLRRTTEGQLRWTMSAFPTPAAAQDAGMSLRDYEDFVYGADLLTEPDPIAAWKALGERQQRIADWLADKSTIRVTGPGTDLTVGTAGRTWINDDGHLNFPGGEVFTGPIENQTEGVVTFNFPAFYMGREATGVRLVYRQGKVVEAGATTNEAFLREMLDADEGARRLGEFAIGLNPGIQRFTKATLFDEKIGGTLHMALGRSIPESGGINVSAVHWDMVYDLRQGAEVTVDGQLFSRNGEIVI